MPRALAFAAAAAVIVAALIGACGGATEPEATPPAAPPPSEGPPAPPAPEPAPPAGPEGAVTTEEMLEPGLPQEVAGYESWPLENAEPIPPREDGDAHLGTKNVYASEEAGGDGLYPEGTIVVKEATRPDADFIGLVAIMRKIEGFDAAHNDWEFVEYTRSAEDEPFTETASGEVCWTCHMGAAETDYVWIATLGLTK